VAAAITLATTALFPLPSHAALKCEEIMTKRACTDSAPRSFEFAPGQTTSVAAPVIDGYPSACWNWARKFQCIETDPLYKCDSGTNFDAVKADCSMVASQVLSTVTINSVNYITSADYSYRCAFGAWSDAPPLPPNKECIVLDTNTKSSNVVPAAPAGSSTAAPINSSIALTETRTQEFVCYAPPVTTCANTCFAEVKNPSTGLMEKKEVACTAVVSQCSTTSNQCAGTVTRNPDGSLVANPAIGPDGRCINSTENQMCQAGTIPRCLTGKDNCTLNSTEMSGIQDNGFALNQDQTYVCTDTKESCTELANVSNCVHVGAWGWDQLSIKSQVGQGLAEYNQAMSKLEGIEKGMKDEDPYIFSGQDLRCHYAVGNFLNTFIMIALVVATMVATGGASAGLLSTALQSGGMAVAEANAVSAAVSIGAAAVGDAPNSKAIGSNCCKDFVFEGSDAWYKLGSCTADEIKLSVAKRKGLTHYLGEYCSKKSGFPVRQCVEKTRSYCVFDDMLALTVNEQGRAQLDALASADSVNTRATAAKRFPLYGAVVSSAPKYTGYLNTGKWVQQAQENKSQVWTWQYPAYCSSTTAQKDAHDTWLREVMAATDTKGIEPSEMTQAQAMKLIMGSVGVAAFQECPSTPGTMSFLTCSKNDDSCDTSRLPEGPTGVETDLTGMVTQADVNWRVQQAAAFYAPGDYGVTTTMAADSTYAAVTESINEFITAVGSCHRTDGQCLYYFTITDKVATKGAGAKKRSSEFAQFPLYTIQQTSSQPAVDYVAKDGTLNSTAYMADPNRGRADPMFVSNQRFIFHPNLITAPVVGNIHSNVLVEYANGKLSAANPENDYKALMVPTSLPPGTPGWYPYGDAAQKGKYFYLSGGCNVNSRWCNYEIMVDLDIARHPWGTAQEPRCWGFSLEQMAALDFDKMDLSRWINSLDLDASTANMSAEAATAMTKQVTDSAQAFYGNVSNSAVTNKPGAGTTALVTNTDVLPMLSNGDFRAYMLEAAVPSNWPNYFPDGVNNNPVTNVLVDWGDGSAPTAMKKDAGGKAYVSEHDYGDLKKSGRFKVTVTLDTGSNGPQTLTTFVSVTPDGGAKPAATPLEFNNPGANGKVQAEYNPADTLNGLNQAPASLENIAPGMADQFDRQGDNVTTKPPGTK
jgi:hypothetical protein